MKFAGWDMIIFEGKSDSPVYLMVENDQAELRDASHLWGTSTWHTEEQIKKENQDPQIRISSIGKAGENQVLFSCVVVNDHAPGSGPFRRWRRHGFKELEGGRDPRNSRV
jgi:aldehyde:ferredoxin oxidoreductase